MYLSAVESRSPPLGSEIIEPLASFLLAQSREEVGVHVVTFVR